VRLGVAAIALLSTTLGATSVRAQGGAARSTVLVPRAPATLAVEEERLIEALRIYTRDRDCRLVVEGDAPATLEGRAAAELLARARRADAALVVWVGRRADGHAVYYVLGTLSGDLRETELEPLGAERTAVDVALKVRAILARPAARDGDAERPEPDAGAPAAPAPPAPAAPAPPPPAAPAEATLVSRPTPPAREEPPPPPELLALGAAYGVFLPTETAWARQGLVLSAELRVARSAGVPLSLVADGGLVNEPSRLVRGFDVTLADLPLGLGALVRGRRGRVGAAFGPRLGLHVLDVSAQEVSAAAGRTGSARRYAAGLGGRVEADVRLFAHMKVFLGVTFEAIVPKQEFTIAGAPAVATGDLMVVGTAGLALLIL
jgi:hypothetical protein